MFLALIFMFGACAGAAAPAQAPAATPADTAAVSPASGDDENDEVPQVDQIFRVASVLSGPITDGAWNETQYNGLRRMEARGAEVRFVENVSGADFVEAIRAFAAEGVDLVILGTNTYEDLCFPVSEDFPDVRFVSMNGRLMSDNFISVRVPNEEQGFLAAVVATLSTQTNIVGFVGGLEITPILRGAYGFEQGVDYVNELFDMDVELISVNTGSFHDVHQAKETAIAMIESGADVVVPMADGAGVGVIEAAEERDIMAVGTGPGHVIMAPNHVLATIMRDNAYVYDGLWEMLVNNDWPAEIETFGIVRDVVYTQDWLEGIDVEIISMVEEVIDRVKAGEMTIRSFD
jgi:basic membrane protein A